MAGVDPNQMSGAWLLSILEDGFRSDPSMLRADRDIQPSVIEDMLGSSPLFDYVRQGLPHKLADTKAGAWIDRKLATPDNPNSLRSGINDALQELSLGGISPENQAYRTQLRSEDPLVRRNTVVPGQVHTIDGSQEIPIGDSFRAKAAQVAGVTAGDVASDGLRNIWWFLNAPQAVASLAVLQALHQPMKAESQRLMNELEYEEGDKPVAPWGSRRVRLAAAVPAVAALSMAIGNAYRQPGYKAALPSEADPTQTSDLLGELGARYFLGRTGELLPYDEFVKERPDVSKGEYDAYKAYLFGSPSPIKASLDGINGPEVNFMGKSVPILTGIAPAVAAVIGARRGMGKAMERLGGHRDGDQLRMAEELRMDYRKKEKEVKGMEAMKAPAAEILQAKDAVNSAKEAYAAIQKTNDLEMTKQAVLTSSAYLVPAAILGQTLESIRRSMPGEDPTAVAPAPAPQPPKKLQPQPLTAPPGQVPLY
jgi:hypothetical protein